MGTFGTKQILLAFAALAVIGGGAYYATSMNGDSAREHAKTGTPTSSKIAAPKTLKDLLGLSQSVKCTFTSIAPMADTEGVVYAAAGKVRGDFTSTAKVGTPGKVMKSHMIVDDTTSYMWSEEAVNGMTMAIKMSRAEIEKPANMDAPRGQPSINEQVDYQCGDWVADVSLFTPPTGIQFQDMEAMMSAAMPTSMPTMSEMPNTSDGPPAGFDANAMKAAQCAACQQTGDSKAQCLAALGCNE